MEYKIFKLLRQQWVIHPIIRIILGTICMIFGAIIVLIPLPFSVPSGILLISLGLIFIIPGNKVKHVIKIRKGVLHLIKNIRDKIHVKRKLSDIWRHITHLWKK